MPFLIIGSALLLCFVAVIMYFFSIAFVKQNFSDVDDLDSKTNEPIAEYKGKIKSGMDYITARDYKWVKTVSYDGLELAARYFDNGEKKTVILFHGYRSSALRDFSCAVEMYTKMGFNVLLCDQRSHGRSEGRLITFGVKESCDVVSWVEFANAHFDPEKIVLGGMSMGATTVLLSLKYNLPDNVKAVVADCGFTSPVAIIKKVARQHFRINATFFIPFLNIACLIFGNFSITKDSTVQTVKNSNIPIMLIHGENDNFVPCDMSRETIKEAGENCKLLIIKDADHGLSFLVDEQKVVKEIGSFLEENLV